jgi:hypothetical protein
LLADTKKETSEQAKFTEAQPASDKVDAGAVPLAAAFTRKPDSVIR